MFLPEVGCAYSHSHEKKINTKNAFCPQSKNEYSSLRLMKRDIEREAFRRDLSLLLSVEISKETNL